MIKLNQTPVRTSKSFGINNIKLQDTEIPKNVQEFEGLTIMGDTSNIEISDNVTKSDIKYGLGDELKNQIDENANQKLQIIIKEKLKENLYLNFDFDEDNSQLLDNIEIIARPKAKATVVIKYKSNCEEPNYHNGMLKLISGKNSEINIIIINLLNGKSNNFITIDNGLQDYAKSDFTIIDLGGKNNISNFYSNIIGNKAYNKISTIYLGKNDQLFDINYISEIKGEQSKVEMEIQGALNDYSKKHFKGTIDFKKGAKKAKGDENEFCMLLSDNARSMALPMLLCSEEEVEGNHASAAGKVDQKALFYIMSRGLSYKEAMKLIVKTKFDKIINNIKTEDLREEIESEIDKRLD